MFNWDFSCGRVNGGKIGSARNLSYSYQCPLTRQGDQTYDGNGVPINADPSLVVVSDRTPVESATAPAGGAFTGASGSPGPWSTNIGSGDVHYYNSQNHDGGSLMNVLYADSHAAAVKTPNVGPAATGNASVCDCIFTNFGSAGPNPANPPDGVDFGGKLGNATHTGNRDTYLWGGMGRPSLASAPGKIRRNSLSGRLYCAPAACSLRYVWRSSSAAASGRGGQGRPPSNAKGAGCHCHVCVRPSDNPFFAPRGR